MQSSIWEDRDVREIYEPVNGAPRLRFEMLGPLDRMLMETCADTDARMGPEPTRAATLRALVTGVDTFESLSDAAPGRIGWQKLIMVNTAANVEIFKDRFGLSQECADFGDWVTFTISKNGWGPDGGETVLGRWFGRCMATAAQAGGGTRHNPRTQRFEAPDGEAARRYELPPE